MSEQVRIGHYILGRTIGTGGFAKVKMARHELTNLEVAVKIINKRKMRNRNMISKVKREIRILKFTNHPNIIKLYEVLDTTNDIFVIMELADRGELYENIDANLPEERARFYFKQIISGVEYIHRNHISHRDLKPENILIDSNNLIKIGDFGLSNLMKDGKLMKTPCGSPFYAAPEIVSQRKYEGTSVDIWSSGVILYALVVGRLPFDDDNITLLYRKIQRGQYVIPPTLSKVAEDLIRRMLQVDPCRRISIADIKTHPWMRSHAPIYMKISDQYIIERECQAEMDEEVLERVLTMPLNFHEYTQDKIRKAIMKRDDESFVIAYELIKSDNDRRQYAEQNVMEEQSFSTILEKVSLFELEEMAPASIDPNDSKYIYGKMYDYHPLLLMEKIIGVLSGLQIEFESKNAQYFIKCVYYNRRVNGRLPEEDRDDSEKKQEKFSKSVLKFNVQIYEVKKDTQTHLVDFQLTQGHPFVFFPLAKQLYDLIEKAV